MLRTHAVGTCRVAYARRAGHEKAIVSGTGYTLYQNRHLFVALIEPAALAVIERRHAHGAGVDDPDRVFKRLQPFLGIALIAAENGFVLARKGIAKAVLEDRTRANDDRIVAVVVEDAAELGFYASGELALHDLLLEFARKREIALLRPLFDPEIPEAVVHDIGVEYVGADIVGVVRLEASEDIRAVVFDDLAREQHAAGFAADHAGADHARVYFKVVLGSEIRLDEFAHFFISCEHDVADLGALLGDVDPALMQELCFGKEAFPAVDVLIKRLICLFVHHAVEVTDLGAVLEHRKAVVRAP